MEVPGKFGLVLEGTDDPEPAGRMMAREQVVPELLGSIHGAPDVGRPDPKHLPGRELVKAREPGLRPVPGRRPPAVRAVRQHDAPVVGDVLAERLHPVHPHAVAGRFGHRVVVVLEHHAHGPLLVLFAGLPVPPVPSVARPIEQPALIVETVRDLVPDHVSNPAVVQVVRPVSREEYALQYACS